MSCEISSIHAFDYFDMSSGPEIHLGFSSKMGTLFTMTDLIFMVDVCGENARQSDKRGGKRNFCLSTRLESYDWMA